MSSRRYGGMKRGSMDPTAAAVERRLPPAPVRRDVPHHDQPGAPFVCQSCGDESEPVTPGITPAGWYTLKVGGSFDERDDIRPGRYCCAECVAVGALRPYGMADTDVRAWLRGGGGLG